MSYISSYLQASPTIKHIEGALDQGHKNLQIYGLPGQLPYEYGAALASRGHPLLILAPGVKEGRRLVELMEARLGGRVAFYPPAEVLAYRTLGRSRQESQEKIRSLFGLADNKLDVLVTTLTGLMEKSLPKDRLLSSAFSLSLGQELAPKDLVARLLDLGYEQVPLVEAPGQFSQRGGLVDVYSLAYDLPLRLEFFDIEVDSIRLFDPDSQQSVKRLKSCRFYPARLLLVEEKARKRALDQLDKREEKLKKIKDQVARDQALEEISQDRLTLSSGGYAEGMDRYLALFYPKLSSLIDFFPHKPLIMVEHFNRLMEDYQTSYDLFVQQFQALFSQGLVLEDYLALRGDLDELKTLIRQQTLLHFSLLEALQGPYPADYVLSLLARSLPSYLGKTDFLFKDIKAWLKESRVFLSLEDEKRRSLLEDKLREEGIPYQSLVAKGGESEEEEKEEGEKEEKKEEEEKDEEEALAPGRVYLLDEPLYQGGQLVDDGLVLVGQGAIFSDRKKKKTKKRRSAQSIRAFTDIEAGDYVVHDQHGVGQYLGITTLDRAGKAVDYLEIAYAKKDKVFIPVDQLDILEKYVGSEGHKPRLSRLGSKDWEKAKEKVRQAIKEIAIDLLDLYAKRQMTAGFEFDKDSAWQKEFEDNFAYQETPDQAQAIEETKKDMESMRPMDRVIIGDVGYGKTEVALRAAFKAVDNSKQVAVLVPTTVLANQHYKTFQARFANWPIRIAVLNRYLSTKQVKAVLEKTALGQVDILIGTHRLLSKDVVFSDLGLVVVDEEQKFGVAHKERLKDLRHEVDFLTLSATPIPRTLHMSLSGARDMSIIESPPEDRLPVKTVVLERSDLFIQRAIQKEMARGGQVYYIHNRVRQLPGIQRRLEAMVPEARLVLAHGQMDKNQLEEAMMTFVEGQADILLSTTIVESGIDIANVNTLIVDDADLMGLSQIYQLKGRVGRSARQAYAYFMYRKDKILSPEAEKRLKVIKEFTDFGAGFKVAMRDLEIRGAGNLLGADQHGHMLSVGFEMYRRLLAEEVDRLKGIEPEEKEGPALSLDLDVQAHIDPAYVRNAAFKMDFYKRILQAQDLAAIYQVRQEMKDRFGKMPISASRLFDLAAIRVMARDLGVTNLVSDAQALTLVFSGQPFSADRIMGLGDHFKRDLIIGSADDLSLGLRRKNRADEDMLAPLFMALSLLDPTKTSCTLDR